MKKAIFAGEFILKEEKVTRPLVTVDKTGGLFRGSNDLICCGMCGSIMSHKAKFCMGCGAKFEIIKDIAKYEQFESEYKNEIAGQMSFDDLEPDGVNLWRR